VHCKAIFILLSAAALAQAGDWPTFRGNLQRTGYCEERVGVPGGEPVWVAHLGCELVSSPSVSGSALYIGGRDSCFYAIDAGTGKILWKKKTGGWVDASPLVHDGKVYAGSRDNTVYGFDKAGEVQLRMEAGLQLSSPAVTAAGLLVTGMGHPYSGLSLFPLNLKTNGLAKIAAVRSVSFSQMSYSSPAVLGQASVIGANDGKVYMVDASAGKIFWELETGGRIYLSTPAIDKAEARVYFAPGNYDRNVYAVGLIDGRIVWKSSGSAAQSLDRQLAALPIPPVKIAELLKYRPDDRRKMIGQMFGSPVQATGLAKQLSGAAADGEWTPLGDMKTSSVALGPDKVYVAQKALGIAPKRFGIVVDQAYMPKFTLLALDKYTGNEAWRFSELRSCVKLGYCSSPVVTQQSVIFGWGEGAVYSLDRKTGALQWQDTLSGDIISSPAVANGSLYVATMAGDVYCFKLMDTPPGLDFQRSTYCYPNPARGGKSNIQVYVERAGKLSIAVYNMAERPVFQVNTDLRAGQKFTHEWQLDKVANGVYFARINVTYVDGKTDRKTLKIAVLK
jgi:outer membrane protein assembly factor BamB